MVLTFYFCVSILEGFISLKTTSLFKILSDWCDVSCSYLTRTAWKNFLGPGKSLEIALNFVLVEVYEPCTIYIYIYTEHKDVLCMSQNHSSVTVFCYCHLFIGVR